MARKPKRSNNMSKKKRDFLRREREKEESQPQHEIEQQGGSVPRQPDEQQSQQTHSNGSSQPQQSTAITTSSKHQKNNHPKSWSTHHSQHQQPLVNKTSLQWYPATISSHSKMISSRQFHSSCVVNNECMYCIGGDDGTTFFPEVWKYDITTKEWTQVSNMTDSSVDLSSNTTMKRSHSSGRLRRHNSSASQKINIFGGRSGHSCVYYKNSLWVFGGRKITTYLGDILRFDLDTCSWHHIYLETIVRARAAHTAVVLNGKMYAFGGVTSSQDISQNSLEYLDSLLIFDFSQMRWVKPETKGTPPRARAGHAMTVGADNNIYIWGGRNGSSILTDFFAFNVTTKTWRRIEVKGKSPKARAGHSLNFVLGAQKQYILLYGGVDWKDYFSDLWLFDVERSEWTRVYQTLADSEDRGPYSQSTGGYAVLNGRGWHTTVQCGTLLLLFGGSSHGVVLNELVVLDLSPLFDMTNHSVTSPSMIPDNTTSSATKHQKHNKPVPGIEAQDKAKRQKVRAHPPVKDREASAVPSQASTPVTPAPPQPSSDRFVGKIVLNEEIRRISLSPDYNEMLAILCKEYNFGDATQFSLLYTDEDDDRVTIRSPNDWEECLRYFNSTNKTVRLELTERSGDSTSQLSVRTDNSFVSSPTPTRTRAQMSNIFNNDGDSAQITQYTTPQTPKTPHTPSRGVIQWQAGRKLGEGAYGKVYMAINLVTKEYMAVKQIKVGTSSQSQTIESIMREINVMKGLEHPNIVKYLGVEYDESKEVLNIFMELVHGGALATVAKQFTCFAENIVRHYTRQILLGLQYLHSKGIIHRDIKGANILISAEGEGVVKLADFGHSKMLQGESMSWQSGTLKGTPLWMAPQVLRGRRKQDQFSDIWSVGCVVLEMSTGKPPWNELLAESRDSNVFVLMQLISKQKYPPKYPEHISKEGKEFLDLCFGMETPVEELLRHPFVTEEYQMVAPIPDNLDENGAQSRASSEAWSQEDAPEELDPNHGDTDFSNYNAMKSYNGLSDLDDSGDDDDSTTGSSNSDEDDDASSGYSSTSEEDISDRILEKYTQDEESRLALESLRKQVATVNQIMKSRGNQSDSQRTIALSQAQVLSCLKEQEDEIESGKKTVEKLGERTARVNARKMRKSRKFVE